VRVLDLFSGIGGFSLGLERAGMKTVAFCEIEPFCRAVLKKHWPDVPQFEDVRKLRGEDVGPVDLVCGGYPCQPFSTAGKRGGAEDDRHLWPEMRRIISECRPDWVLAENVAGHITLGLDEVLSDLDALGYASRAFVIPACAVDAPHRRDRVWIVANANSQGLEGRERAELRERGTQRVIGKGGASVRNASSPRLQDRQPGPMGRPGADTQSERSDRWPSDAGICRVANGVPNELDFFRGVANEQSGSAETKPEDDFFNWKVLRAMWEHGSSPASSRQLYVRGMLNSLPGLPREAPQGGWYLGPWIKNSEGLRGLWQEFYSKSYDEAQDLQRTMLERVRSYKRPKAMGSRVDRIKSLGNAVVPQVVEIIGRAIMQAEAA
jgi:DNA (cytosine-5)-methyltransferase 1